MGHLKGIDSNMLKDNYDPNGEDVEIKDQIIEN